MVDFQKLPEFSDHKDFHANLFYLEEHGLISSLAKREHSIGAKRMIFTGIITARGLDFLEDDGGLSAILGAVTIKLDRENIRKLLELKIESLDIPQDKKRGISATIRDLSSDAMRHLCIKLIDLGLDSAPDVYHLLQTWLHRSAGI